MLELAERTTCLSPANVVTAVGGRLRIALPNEEVWATCAMAYPYQPDAGDVVLAIGDSAGWYVIGVLQGSGPVSLTVPGDLVIDAPRGRITLTAAKGVELKAEQVRVTAKRLDLIAHSALEQFGAVTRWVKDAFQLRAGRVRTRVEGVYDVAADRIIERAARDVKIDGKKINLG